MVNFVNRSPRARTSYISRIGKSKRDVPVWRAETDHTLEGGRVRVLRAYVDPKKDASLLTRLGTMHYLKLRVDEGD